MIAGFSVKPITFGYFTLDEQKKKKHRRKRKNSFKRMKTPYRTPMRRQTHAVKSPFNRENIEKLWTVEKKIGTGIIWVGGKAFQGAKAGAGYFARKLPVGIKQKMPGSHEGIRSIASEVKEQKGNKQPTINYGKREGRKE